MVSESLKTSQKIQEKNSLDLSINKSLHVHYYLSTKIELAKFLEKMHSLPVPNVQALSASLNGLSKIPDRYIRPEAHHTESIVHHDGVELPIVDLARLEDPMFSCEEAAKLESACKEWGFFQLVNHGVPENLIGQLKADVIEFFSKSLEEKKAYEKQPGDVQGYGQTFVQSDEQKLDWSDMLNLMTRPTIDRKMKFWPTSPSTFRDTIDRYSLELARVAKCLFNYIAKNLSVAPEIFGEIFKDQSQALRFNYYPPCAKPDEVLGISPHSDADGITLLLEINNVQGLQIRKDGDWIAVNALPCAFIVNIGDIIEVLSNGIYKSIEHRATVNTEKERISIAAFHGPDEHTILQPLPEIVGDGKVKFKSISYLEFMKMYFASKLDGKNQLDVLRC
ncbi:hypothetical protein LUZ60_016879 [Juncus effusus]|nr:hypothetical protein LUZ60_016879 [Juncus effusus]